MIVVSNDKGVTLLHHGLRPYITEERAVPHEELYSECSDEKLLLTIRASVSDVREIMHRSLIAIEQSRIMLHAGSTAGSQQQWPSAPPTALRK